MFEVSFMLSAALSPAFNGAMSRGSSALQRLQNRSAELVREEQKLNQTWRASQGAAQAYQSRMAALTEQYTAGQMSQSQYSHAVAQAQAAMNQAAMSAGQYRNALGRIRQEATETADAMSIMQRAQAAKSNFTSAVGSFMTTASAVSSAVAPVRTAVETAMDFEATMSKVKAITNSNTEDMAKLTAQAQELGRTTMFSAAQAGEAMTYLGMAGWNTTQIMAGMPGMLDLAAASGSDLATVADIVSDDLTAFGMSAEQAGHMADVFAAASTNANTNVEMMGMTFKYAGAVAGALGYSLEDVAVATGLMANAGIKGEQAGTSLRAIMTRLVSPPKAAAEAMGQLGISVTNADGTVKPFKETMEELRDRFSGLSDSEKAEMATNIAGQEAMSGFLAVVNASESDFEKLCGAVDNADGAAAKMAQTMQDNAQGAMTALKSAAEGLAISVGNVLLPVVKDGANALASIASAMAKWTAENPRLIQTLTGVATAMSGMMVIPKGIAVARSVFGVAATQVELYGLKTKTARTAVLRFAETARSLTWGGVVGQVANGFSKMGGMATTAFSTIKGALQGFNLVSVLRGAAAAMQGFGSAIMGIARAGLAAAFSPLGIAVMALAAAAYYCYTNWETVGPLFMSLWETIQTAFANGWAMIQPALQGLFDAFGVLSGVVGENSGIFSTLAEILGGAVVGAFVVVATVMVNQIATAVQVVSSLIAGAITVFTGLIQFITGVFTGDWTAAWQGVLTIFSGIFGTLERIANSVLGGIKNTLNSIADKASKIHIFGGGDEIAHNASGGIYNKGAFLTTFAEDSPEAAIPLDGSQRAIGLWQRAGEMLGMGKAHGDSLGGSGGSTSYAGAPPITINLTVNGNADANGIYDAVGRAAEAARQSFADQMAAFRREERRLAYG